VATKAESRGAAKSNKDGDGVEGEGAEKPQEENGGVQQYSPKQQERKKGWDKFSNKRGIKFLSVKEEKRGKPGLGKTHSKLGNGLRVPPNGFRGRGDSRGLATRS